MTNDELRATAFAALGRVPSGLFILTYGPGRNGAARLVSWVQQSAFEPPMVTLAINRQKVPSELGSAGARFALNQLGDGQTELLRHFGKGFGPSDPVFEGIDVVDAPGPAVLAQANAVLQCEVSGRLESGDHELIVARVVGGQVRSTDAPYVHIRKSGSRY
jgi:flavin reductase (DIM6/NTAB) family NADH-FMN oxidoreductase RutF